MKQVEAHEVTITTKHKGIMAFKVNYLMPLNYNVARNARKIDNFLQGLKAYLELKDIKDEAQKIWGEAPYNYNMGGGGLDESCKREC